MASYSSTFWLVIRRLMLFATVCLILAYPASRFGVFEWPRAYDPLALPDLQATPGFLTGWQLKAVDVVPENCAMARLTKPA